MTARRRSSSSLGACPQSWVGMGETCPNQLGLLQDLAQCVCGYGGCSRECRHPSHRFYRQERASLADNVVVSSGLVQSLCVHQTWARSVNANDHVCARTAVALFPPRPFSQRFFSPLLFPIQDAKSTSPEK